MKKVSIIVPVYQVERFIGQCAKSLFEQSYKEIEYLFVDDCSPDNSVEVLRNILGNYPYKTEQVKIIKHDVNRGSGAARLTAMQQATGELIMFVDSDDYISHDCVELLVECQTRTDADIVDADYTVFTGDKMLKTVPAWVQLSDEKYIKATLIQNTVTHNLWARIFRRELFTNTGVNFVEGINLAEDYAIMGRIMLSAHRECLSKVVYYYRQNDYGTFADGISARHIDSFLRANSLVCDYIRKNDKDRRFRTAQDIGLLNVFFLATNAGKTKKDVMKLCGTPSNIIMKGIAILFGGKALRWAYLLIKKAYKACVLHIS